MNEENKEAQQPFLFKVEAYGQIKYLQFWYHNGGLFLQGHHDITSDMKPCSPDMFPFVDDFEILPEKRRRYGYHLYFESKKTDFVSGFPWWDHVENDICREDFEIPCKYFEDKDQGWEILIFEYDELVYILEGDSDHPEAGYQRWCKVEKRRYLEQWQLAISRICQQTAKRT